MATARKAPARKTPARKPAPRPNTASAQSKRIDALEARVEALEGIILTAKRKQQQAAAAKLAANPEQLAALRELVAMAGGGE